MNRIAILIGNGTFGLPVDQIGGQDLQAYQEQPGLPDLKYPGNDVSALAAVLKDRDIGNFDGVFDLVNKKAKRILELTEDVMRDNSDAFILFYYTGHGKIDSDGRLFLAARDTRADKLHSSGLRFESLIEMKSAHAISRMGIVLDCCYAGIAEDKVKGVIEDKMGAMLGGNGVFFLGACGRTQQAREDDALGHGVLTAGILEAIRSGTADYDNDGCISAPDLLTYCQKFMRAFSKQEPVCVNRSSGQNLQIAYAFSRLGGYKIDVARERISFCSEHKLLGDAELMRLGAFFQKEIVPYPVEKSFELGFLRYALGEIQFRDLDWYRHADGGRQSPKPPPPQGGDGGRQMEPPPNRGEKLPPAPPPPLPPEQPSRVEARIPIHAKIVCGVVASVISFSLTTFLLVAAFDSPVESIISFDYIMFLQIIFDTLVYSLSVYFVLRENGKIRRNAYILYALLFVIGAADAYFLSVFVYSVTVQSFLDALQVYLAITQGCVLALSVFVLRWYYGLARTPPNVRQESS